MSAGADAVVDQVLAVHGFCLQNAPNPNYDFRALAERFTRFKNREFGNITIPADKVQEVQRSRERAMKSFQTHVLSAVKEENGARPFCKAAYAKWINIDQRQFGEMIRRSYREYKSRAEATERPK